MNLRDFLYYSSLFCYPADGIVRWGWSLENYFNEILEGQNTYFKLPNNILFSKPFNHFNNFFIKIFFLSVFNYIINRAGPFKLTLEPSSYHC